MSDTDAGPCDHCGGDIGERGWMKPTGETMRLTDDGPDLPVHRFYCSEACAAVGAEPSEEIPAANSSDVAGPVR